MKKYFFCFVLIFFVEQVMSDTATPEPIRKFFSAWYSSNTQQAKEILRTEVVDLNVKIGDHGDRLLHFLIRTKSIEMAEYIISLGADINIRMDDGQTPLHEAADFRSGEVISRFIDLGADVHAVDDRGETPLHNAAFRGNVSAINMLKEKGADIYAQNKEGNTPLHKASHYGGQGLRDSVDISLVIDSLMQKTADLYLKNNKGRTPLHEAVQYNTIEAVKYFFDLVKSSVSDYAEDHAAKAYANEPDHNGLSAIDIAREKKKKRTLKKGIMRVLSPYSPYSDKVEGVKNVIKRGFFRRCLTLFSRAH